MKTKQIFKKTVWVIISKDRKVIAKGTPRNRCLIEINNKKDNKRVLTYASKGVAESAFTNGNGFYNEGILEGYNHNDDDLSDYLEAVECEMTIKLKG